MIGSLSGKVTEVDPEGELLLEVNGVGYRVTVTAATLASVGRVGTKTAKDLYLWISQVVRDEVPRLIGFTTRDERHCFELLLKAQGVGPALALSVLSHLSPAELRRAVLSNDPKALTVVSGVGMRTAQRMLIDLESKLGVVAVGPITSSAATDASALAEVSDGLAGMGFSPQEIKTALNKLPETANDPDADVSELLRLALQAISSKS